MGFYKRLAVHELQGTIPADPMERWVLRMLKIHNVSSLDDLPEKELNRFAKKFEKDSKKDGKS